MAYTRNPRKRIIRGPSSSDELRRGGRRTSEEFDPDDVDAPFVRLGSSAIGTQQDVVQRIGDAIIGGDFGGNARGRGAIDIQITRDYDDPSGDSQVASGIDSIAIGASSTASGLRSVAIGISAIASGLDGVALNGTASGQTGLALQGVAAAIQSIAIGQDSAANASGSYGVALGPQAKSQAFAAVALGYQAKSAVNYQGVIAATALKMQTVLSPLTYESIITTADTPVAGNLVSWADVDRIGDAGVAVSGLSVAFSTSAQLAALLSDETGYSAGALAVFSISPVLTTPNLGTPSAVVLTNATGLPTAGLVDAAVTLAKMANLAQDQFIGRVTASTGVPETATITAAARTVLDDATVAAMVDTLGGAAAVGSGGLARATSPVFATQISTPAIAAPVALTITPAAGEGVTVALSSIGGVLNVNGLLIGGLGSRATAGTLDWNDATNARPGSGNVLLRDSTASNAPASSASTAFRQSFSFEHLTKDATGNITQLAIPYGLSTSMDAGLYMRGRFSAVWGSWLRILSEDSAGVVAMLGTAARTVQIDRNLTANTAGYALTVKAGGATSGATDKAGGDLLLKPGDSTGSAESGVQIYGVVAGASGTADRTQTVGIRVLGNKLGFYAVTPVVRPTALTAGLTALTHTAPGTPDYALQNLTLTGYGFVSADEGNTALSVLVRTALRVGELETKLQALGLLT